MIETLTAMFSAWPWTLVVSAAFAGGVFASFAGLVAARLPHQIGWRDNPEPGLTIAAPRSRCEGCGRSLSAAELVPVLGWLLCRGRCRTCGHRISFAYPAIEAATAAASAALALAFGPSAETAALLAVLWCGLALSWLDVQDHLIPEAITIPLFWAGLLFSPFEPDPSSRILGGFLAAAAMWIAFGAIRLAGRIDGVSGGDVALAAVGGAWLGASGVPPFLLGASILAVATAAVLRGDKQGIPWGPGLILSMLGVMMSGVRWP